MTPAPVTPDRLTPRERQVLALIARGLSNAEVSDRLHLSPATLRSHVRMAYRRIGVTRRVDALLWWHQHATPQDVTPDVAQDVDTDDSPSAPSASLPRVGDDPAAHPWGATRTEDHAGLADQHDRGVPSPGTTARARDAR